MAALFCHGPPRLGLSNWSRFVLIALSEAERGGSLMSLVTGRNKKVVTGETLRSVVFCSLDVEAALEWDRATRVP